MARKSGAIALAHSLAALDANRERERPERASDEERPPRVLEKFGESAGPVTHVKGRVDEVVIEAAERAARREIGGEEGGRLNEAETIGGDGLDHRRQLLRLGPIDDSADEDLTEEEREEQHRLRVQDRASAPQAGHDRGFASIAIDGDGRLSGEETDCRPISACAEVW